MKDIIDTETNEPVDWGEIFFRLHKYCNLNKWDIWNYTLPQVIELLKATDKYIQFQVEIQSMGMGAMFGGGGMVSSLETDVPGNTKYEDGYEVLNEDGFRMLSNALGGG